MVFCRLKILHVETLLLNEIVEPIYRLTREEICYKPILPVSQFMVF